MIDTLGIRELMQSFCRWAATGVGKLPKCHHNKWSTGISV